MGSVTVYVHAYIIIYMCVGKVDLMIGKFKVVHASNHGVVSFAV